MTLSLSSGENMGGREVHGVKNVHTVLLCAITKNNTKINVLKQIEKKKHLILAPNSRTSYSKQHARSL